jgi:hypothetical protein
LLADLEKLPKPWVRPLAVADFEKEIQLNWPLRFAKTSSGRTFQQLNPAICFGTRQGSECDIVTQPCLTTLDT